MVMTSRGVEILPYFYGMKKTVTFKQLIDAVNVSGMYLAEHAEQKDTKFCKFLQRFIKYSRSNVETYNEKIEDINLQHCYENPDTKLIEYDVIKDRMGSDKQVYRFSRQGLINKTKAIRDLGKERTEVHVYIFPDPIPSDLNDIQKLTLAGLVINEALVADDDYDQENTAVI